MVGKAWGTCFIVSTGTGHSPGNTASTLTGDLRNYRECHIKPDLLLSYAKREHTLHLTRIGSHTERYS